MRQRRDAGYTLLELLIVCAAIGLVAAAASTITRVAHQTFIRTASGEEALLGARAGVAQMIDDLRLVGAYYTGVTGSGAAITAATPTSITFLADVDADSVHGGIETTNTSVALLGATTVALSGTAAQVGAAFNTYSTAGLNDWVYIGNGVTREARHVVSVSGTTVTLAAGLAGVYLPGSIVRSVETVTYAFDATAGTVTRRVGGGLAEAVVGNATALTFTYFDLTGGATTVLSAIREIHVSLTTRGPHGDLRTMTSRVRPRNMT